SGIPEEHAAEYESGIKEGGIFMGVNARNQEDADYLHNDWNGYGHKVYSSGRSTGTSTGTASGASFDR
ncbi:MAG TPA: hypothetical protein VGD05_01260, partial [Pyrinomonadaceae bacterium]